MRGVLALWAALSLCAATAAPGAAVQYPQIALQPDPGGRVVAIAIRFPSGSADDAPGLEGAAHLLGRILEDEANRRVLSHGAFVRVDVTRDDTIVSLVASPEDWTAAFRALEETIYDAALPGSRLAPVREELLEILAFESGAPVRAFETELARFLRGVGDPGSRPPRGTASTVEILQLEDLNDFRRRHLVEERAAVVVAGPVTATALETLVSSAVRTLSSAGLASGSAFRDGAGPVVSESRDPAPASGISAPELELHRDRSPLEVPVDPTGAPAWTVGERVVMDRQLTSTWMAVSFPFPRGTPEFLLDFLGHLVLEGLNPSPPDPGLYGAEVSVLSLDGAPVLTVSAGVDPRIASRWEDRLTSALDSIAAEPPAGSFFELTRRRFRSELLLDRAVPENGVTWLVRRIAEDPGPVPDPAVDVWRLQRESVARAAATAGPPRTILYGPLEMMDR